MTWFQSTKYKRDTIAVSELAYYAADEDSYRQYGMGVRCVKATEHGSRHHSRAGTRKYKVSLSTSLIFFIIGGAICLLLYLH